jgi:preprotein translocase subunit SecY
MVGRERAGRDPVVDLLLAEYTSLRQESLEALEHRLTIITFSFGSLALIAFLSRGVPDAVAGWIALLVVPLIAKAALLLWLGEYERSHRAGLWIAHLEAKLNAHVGEDAMGWETALSRKGERGKDSHMSYPYVATIFIILVSGHVGILAGLLQLRADLENPWVALGCAVTLLMEIGFIILFLRMWKSARVGNRPSLVVTGQHEALSRQKRR